MFVHYYISKSANNFGEQGAAKLGEGLSKLINISNLTLEISYFNRSIIYEKFNMNFFWKTK